MPGKLRMSMREFRKVQMEPSHAEATWELLKNAIRQIHSQNASGLSFEELYRNAYNLVLHKYGSMLYNGLRDVVGAHLRKVAEEVASLTDGSDFVLGVDKAWADHSLSMIMIRDILLYMDRAYVENKGIKPVYQLGLQLFCTTVIQHPRVEARLSAALLDIITAEREGQIVDRELVKRMTEMYVALGEDSLSVYKQYFETPFLLQSREYYQNEALAYIADNSAAAHLRRAAARLDEERSRVAHCLDASTEAAILAVVDTEFIANHMKTIVNMDRFGLSAMLDGQRVDELELTYTLLERVAGGRELLLDALTEYIVSKGKLLVADKMMEAKNGPRSAIPRRGLPASSSPRKSTTSFSATPFMPTASTRPPSTRPLRRLSTSTRARPSTSRSLLTVN
ncbi:uncharacterized protein AMSG_11828 [Thecamonas trahens ATCC 50062]|uniref:Cullin N-terminal domain-containing protein n=1 Tax=Thecamonas trahens ATCC 50062 TaxID=461836 RepID=A0A0L0D7P4_THETB|nr:hypothetical protein AMSG_11828 [Thecamonas trahens ATCC 50062]KNC48379.1 hypothetical protein AMSG_11828 [Thecamonas trahens ATCC 50062]|eukprot:XP_013758663.1 hypothetical protein AMSG_11828 [Thecamonas trahens ATCC 50062]